MEGGYWLVPPAPGAELAIVACGPVVVEALEAHQQILEDIPGAGLLVVTSSDRLYRGWSAAARPSQGQPPLSHIEHLLNALPGTAGLVTVLDGHPATLSWLAAVRCQPVAALGVERFGQSGDIPDLYRTYGLDADAIIGAAARLCVRAARRWRDS